MTLSSVAPATNSLGPSREAVAKWFMGLRTGSCGRLMGRKYRGAHSQSNPAQRGRAADTPPLPIGSADPADHDLRPRPSEPWLIQPVVDNRGEVERWGVLAFVPCEPSVTTTARPACRAGGLVGVDRA